MVKLGKTCFDSGEIPVDENGKAFELWLCFCQSLHMRVFHLTWLSFFVCFFGWFATANLWLYIQADIGLTDVDRGVAGSASVASTVAFRIMIGFMCDRIGPRYCYPFILIASALPIGLMAIVHDALGYIVTSFFIGLAGASFVVTIYHSTSFFTGSIVGTVNATTAGWGNFGGGVANAMMPLFFQAVKATDPSMSNDHAWRYTMLVPCLFMLLLAPLYLLYTTDTPRGNFQQLKTLEQNEQEQEQGPAQGQGQDQTRSVSLASPSSMSKKTSVSSAFKIALVPISHQFAGVDAGISSRKGKPKDERSPLVTALSNYRTWILVLEYASCFGIELTVLRFCAGYFIYDFDMNPTAAGFVVALFSLMNLFARPLGGIVADFVSRAKGGLRSRVYTLLFFIFFEGFFLVLFGLSTIVGELSYALVMLVCFGIFVQASEGATYAIVPFVEPEAVGSVAGVVGAGGNLGAMIFALALFVHVPQNMRYDTALQIMGAFIIFSSFFIFLIRFDQYDEDKQQRVQENPKIMVSCAQFCRNRGFFFFFSLFLTILVLIMFLFFLLI